MSSSTTNLVNNSKLREDHKIFVHSKKLASWIWLICDNVTMNHKLFFNKFTWKAQFWQHVRKCFQFLIDPTGGRGVLSPTIASQCRGCFSCYATIVLIHKHHRCMPWNHPAGQRNRAEWHIHMNEWSKQVMNVRAAGGLLSPGTRTIWGGDGEVNTGMCAAKV